MRSGFVRGDAVARLAALVVGLAAALAFAAPAQGFVYWTNTGGASGTTIGRANPDGSGAQQGFIGGLSAPSGIAVDGRHIYWANQGTHSIGRADLDGGSADPNFVTGATDPTGVAVDGGHIYWTNEASTTIGRANLDGGGVDNSFIMGVSSPLGIAVDGSHIYWADSFNDRIGRANLDGSAVTQKFIDFSTLVPIPEPAGLAVDGSHIYWADVFDSTIGRANLDGSAVNDNFITGEDSPIGIAVDGQHLYWANAGGNSVGRGNLDGSAVTQDFVAATNPNGVTVDAAPPGAAPTVAGEHVLGVGQISATVGAVVNPNGGATSYHVEWGPTASYGSTGPDLPSAGPLTGQGDQAVAAQLTGLSPQSSYHWRIVATNATGTTPGADQTLTTGAAGPSPTASFTIGAPSQSGQRTVISATGSSGNGSRIVSYKWDWTGSGQYNSSCSGGDPVAMPVYVSTGTYHVGLLVTAADGQSSSTTQTVTISHVPMGATPGAGSVVHGFSCGSVVGNALCTNHVQWDLLVADALDNGCFQEVPALPGTPRAICSIACARDTAALTAGGVVYVPPGVANWLHKSDAKVWSASGRVLVNGTIIAPKDQLIGVGDPHGRHFIKRQASVVISEVLDTVYSGRADVFVKGNGGVPDTVLARDQVISAKLPPSVPFSVSSLGGAADQAARASVAHTADSANASNPCEGPLVKGLPTLATFADPAQAGLNSNIDDFPLAGGPVTVHVIDGRVIVCVDVTLPAIAPCPGDGSSGFVLRATLFADQGGLELQNLRARLPCAVIAGVVFNDVFFNYDANGHHWAAGGTVEAIPGLPLTGVVEFAHGQFVHAHASLATAALVTPPIQVTSAGIDVYPDHTTGGVGLGLYPVIPGINKSLLDIGQYELNWGADPPFFRLTGTADTFGIPLANAVLKVYPDHANIVAHVGANFFDAFRATADLSGDVASVSPLRFNLFAHATVSVLDLVDFGGELLISDNGAAACVEISRNLGLFHFHLHIGAAIRWDLFGPDGIDVMFTGCDVGVVRDAAAPLPARDIHSRAAAAAAGFVVPVAKGTSYEIIGIDGAGAPPAVQLDGPRGEKVQALVGRPSLGARYVVLHSPVTHSTFVIVTKPAAGRWSVSALPGSAGITAVHYATSLPPVSVKARVGGAGRHRFLTYRIARIAGQRVRLLERGRGTLRSIAVVTGGGSGTVSFSPAPGPGGKRQIVAIVEQFRRPRSELTVASYTAPPPARLTRPQALRAVRARNSLRFSWRRVVGADAYAITIRTTDHRSTSTLIARSSFTLIHVADTTSARIAVRAVSARQLGPQSSLAIRGAKPRKGGTHAHH